MSPAVLLTASFMGPALAGIGGGAIVDRIKYVSFPIEETTEMGVIGKMPQRGETTSEGVIKPGCWVLVQSLNPNRTHSPHAGWDRPPKVGDLIQVTAIDSDGDVRYASTPNTTTNFIGRHHVVWYANAIAAGDKVEVMRNSNDVRRTDDPSQPLKRGDVVTIVGVGNIYLRHNTNPTLRDNYLRIDDVRLLPKAAEVAAATDDDTISPRTIAAILAACGMAIAAAVEYKSDGYLYERMTQMQIFQDPTVQRAFAQTLVAGSYFVQAAMVWFGIKAGARGVAKMGSHHREVKQAKATRQTSEVMSLIAAVREALQEKKVS